MFKLCIEKVYNMKNKLIMTIITGLVLAGSVFAFAANAPQPVNLDMAAAQKAETKAAQSANPPANANTYQCVKPLDVVANPDMYLNKKIKFRAAFDKFSTLGLDYKPALRDSQKYISFLIKRDDVTDHTIPLSEMKIFIKRTEAEKFIDLDSGDIIEVYGKVFSNALTDSWIYTEKIVVVEKKNKDSMKKD